MAIWRRHRKSDRPRGTAAASASIDPATARPVTRDVSTPTRPDADSSATTVIDLRNDVGWAARIQPDSGRAAEMAERFRERKARAEAAADLRRLRARHWSGERLVEESRFEAEWWEHSEADPYAVLGVLPGASLGEVAAARRQIAKECHPDGLYDDDEAREDARQHMIAANAAYDRIRRALRV